MGGRRGRLLPGLDPTPAKTTWIHRHSLLKYLSRAFYCHMLNYGYCQDPIVITRVSAGSAGVFLDDCAPAETNQAWSGIRTVIKITAKVQDLLFSCHLRFVFDVSADIEGGACLFSQSGYYLRIHLYKISLHKRLSFICSLPSTYQCGSLRLICHQIYCIYHNKGSRHCHFIWIYGNLCKSPSHWPIWGFCFSK